MDGYHNNSQTIATSSDRIRNSQQPYSGGVHLLAQEPQTDQPEGRDQVLVSGMPLEGCGYPGLCCKKGCWAEAGTGEQHWAPGSQSRVYPGVVERQNCVFLVCSTASQPWGQGECISDHLSTGQSASERCERLTWRISS